MMKKVLIILYTIFLVTANMYGINDKIYSQGNLSAETLARFLLLGNEKLDSEVVNEFATIYIEEATLEGINWDVAFVQMCLETGFLKFGGLVTSNQNNFCGLGSFDSNKGAFFPTIREGVRAHVQHLKAYSSTDKLNGVLLDPRFHFVERGSALTVNELAGRWATDPDYGIKLTSLLKRVHYLENPKQNEIAIGSETISDPIITEVEEIVKDTLVKTVDVIEDKKETVNDTKKEIVKKNEPYKVVIGGTWIR